MPTLSDHDALAALPAELASQLQAAAQILHWETGRVLLQADRLPEAVVLIRSGRVRLIAEDPLDGPFSYAECGAGSWLGWAGLARAEACETVLAMEPVEAQWIPAQRWLELQQQWPPLQQLIATPSAAELVSAMLAWWQQHPSAGGVDASDAIHLRVQRRLHEWAQQPSLARLANAAERDDPQHRSADRIWLWSGHPQQQRLLSLERSWLERDNQPWIPTSSQRPPDAPPLADPLDPAELGLPASPLAAHGALPFSASSQGSTPLGSAERCLQRLCRLTRVPLPGEALREALRDADQRLGGLNLMHLGQLAESLGFEARPLQAPVSHLHRLQGYALLQRQGHFVLLEAASARGWQLADPSAGLLQLPIAAVRDEWSDGVELMLLRCNSVADEHGSSGTAVFDLPWFIHNLSPYRGRLAVLLLTGFCHKLLELVFPLAILQIVDVVVGGGNASLLWPITIVLGLTAVVIGVLGSLREVLQADLSDRLDTNLGSQVVGHLFRLPLRFFDRRTVGDLAARLHDLQQVREFLTETALSSLLDLLFLPILLVTVFLIQPVLASVVLLQVPLLIALNAGAGRLSQRLLSRRNSAWSRAQGLLVEVLTAIRTVKSQNFAAPARWQWLERYKAYTAADYRLTVSRSLVKEGSTSVVNLGKMLLFVVAAWLALQGQTSVGAIFAVYLLSSGITGPLVNLSRLWDQYRDAKAAMAAVADVVGHPPEQEPHQQHLALPPVQGQVRFQKVSFSYGLDSRQLLQGFDLTLEAGSFVGLVGLSGSGKSTVVQLIDRLYQPEAGRVFIDGIDIAQVQLSSLRTQVGFVPQDSILFDGTVLDNLRLNHPEAPLEAVIAAARIACAHEFISELPMGYATPVGERGGGLSGGQKQRIAIARMVLQHPRLVILDEATSALDADTERRVVANLREHFSGRSLLFVTHRLGNLRQADRILVMEQGLVVEDGTWASLMQQQGAFATLARQQHETEASS